MFQINSYLQYRNTPDGKPRVLREGVDYLYISYNKEEFFYEYTTNIREANGELSIFTVGNPKDKTDKGFLINIDTGYDQTKHKVANLSDCRPLLSVEIDGKVWTEGDIIEQPKLSYPELFHKNYQTAGGILSFIDGDLNFLGFNYNNKITKIHYGGGSSQKPVLVQLSKSSQKYPIKKIGSFFDDPAKYSKLLWNCSEEEGWNKVFKLLNITL